MSGVTEGGLTPHRIYLNCDVVMRIRIIACRFGVGSSIFIFYFMIPDPASTFNTGSDPGKNDVDPDPDLVTISGTVKA